MSTPLEFQLFFNRNDPEYKQVITEVSTDPMNIIRNVNTRSALRDAAGNQIGNYDLTAVVHQQNNAGTLYAYDSKLSENIDGLGTFTWNYVALNSSPVPVWQSGKKIIANIYGTSGGLIGKTGVLVVDVFPDGSRIINVRFNL